MEIHGDGSVVYRGDRFVAVTGERRGRAPRAVVHKLFTQFLRADCFWSFDRYSARVTDLPEYTTSIAFDGQAKSVVDYAGGMAGMPPELIALETAIDQAANTDQWVKGAGRRPEH